MPRPTPPGGPKIAIGHRYLASEMTRLDEIAEEHDFDTITDAVRFLLNKADPLHFQGPTVKEDE